MKKRLICCLIVLALCLSVFAGCATSFDNDTLFVTIQNIERDLLKVTNTPDAYELSNTVETYDAKGNEATIYVKWKIEGSTLITLTANGDKTTVNVPANRDSNIPYTLRATLVDKNGKAYLDEEKQPYTAKVDRIAPAGTGGTGGNTDDTGGNTTPTEGNGTLNSPYTVAQALAEISKLAAKTYSSEVYVRGIVSGTVSTGSKGDLKFDIVDSGSSDTLNVRYPTLPATITTVSEGDIVVVSGALTDYNGTKEITFYNNGGIGCTLVSLTPGSSSGGNTGPGGDNTDPGTPNPNGTQTLTLSMEKYATDNNWTVSVQDAVVPYTTVNVICATLTVSATKNDKSDSVLSGAYYGNNTWRLYGSESAKLQFTAKSGYTIVSVKITLNKGTFTNGSQTVSSGTVVNVNGTSLTLTVPSGTSAQITQIEIVYKAS